MEKILIELEKANNKFPNFNTPHEGYAVIQEEMDELWDEVKKVKYPLVERELEALEKECIQVAAMCIKFIDSFNNFRNWKCNSKAYDKNN